MNSIKTFLYFKARDVILDLGIMDSATLRMHEVLYLRERRELLEEFGRV